jgi:hypothetical protein
MGRTVRELLGEMDSHELSEWMAFDMVDPVGGKRGDYQAATVASTIANANRGKGQRALHINDFMPEYGVPEQVGSLESWLSQRVAEQAWGNDASGQAAAAGDNPDEDGDDQRLRGAGGELGELGDGVGRVDAAAGGDA